MRSDIKFSVVIPLYNKEKYIARSISSVLHQTYENFELLVIDDGSTDESCRVATSIKDSRIRLLQKENGGESSARNFGIRHSSNEYIAFLDADDEWAPNFLGTIAGLIYAYPKASIFSTGIADGSHGSAATNSTMGIHPTEKQDCYIDDYYRFAAHTNTLSITSSSVVVEKKVFDDVGVFNETLKRGADLEMWFRINAKYKYAFSSYIGATYHTEAQGRVCNEGREFYAPFLLMINGIRLENNDSSLKKSMDFYLFTLFKQECIQALSFGDTNGVRSMVVFCKKYKFYNFFQFIWLWLLTFLPIKYYFALKRKVM